MRVLLLCLLTVLSVGCSGGGAGPAGSTLIDQTVAEALATESDAAVSIVGYLVQDERGVVLTGGMSFAADPPTPLAEAPELWLGPTPPEEPALTPAGERSFALVRVVGIIEGPGTFGPTGLAYQVREPRITAVAPRPTQLTALLAAAATSENQVLQISGQLLSGPGTNLLVEELGPGGVPDAAARQIKLIMPAGDPALNERLAPGGGVRYGPVEVIGIWRAGSIYALAIVPTDG
jgi:hypothetical protein